MTEQEDGGGLQLRKRILHGIDVVSISRLQERLDEWPKLAGRIFTTAELEYAQSRPHPAEHLAVRFAAKEATFKALGSGWPKLSWLDVEVVSDGSSPSINLSGQARVDAAGYEVSVSLSHDAGIAAAQVLLLRAD